MMDKALFRFSIGVFGLAAKKEEGSGEILVKVNERTDQERQKEIAKIDLDSDVRIVDCPGGAVRPGETLWDALIREIQEETGGCTIITLGDFSAPLFFFNKDQTKPSDAAFWMPIRLIGEPKPSNEALSHPWISRKMFEDEYPFRPVSGLGKLGRTGQMIDAALRWFENNRKRPEIFS